MERGRLVPNPGGLEGVFWGVAVLLWKILGVWEGVFWGVAVLYKIVFSKGIPCQIDAEPVPYAPRALFDMEFYVKPFDMEPMSILTWSSMSKL